MIGIDTNVLVRYLTQDDPVQSQQANQFIEQAITDQELLFINHVVFCELCWVLSRAYRYPKGVVLEVLEKILLARQFEAEAKDLLWRALADFRQGPADFADCLIGVKNQTAGCSTTATFDLNAGSLPGFQYL